MECSGRRVELARERATSGAALIESGLGSRPRPHPVAYPGELGTSQRPQASRCRSSSLKLVESLGRAPNGPRLSCGAELKRSQMKSYNTGGGAVIEPIGDGRRQLQALVRQGAANPFAET